ncbi:MAG: hypothetical protein ACYDEX_11195 [Mobilitalea sp.]
MRRRIAVLVLILLFSLLISIPVASAYVYEPWPEELDAAVGFEWVLVDIVDYELTNTDDRFDVSNTYNRNTFSFSYSSEDSSAASVATFSKPLSSFKGGDTLEIDVTNKLTSKERVSDLAFNYSSSAKIMIGEFDLAPDKASTSTRSFEPQDGTSNIGVGALYSDETEATAKMIAVAPYGKKEGNKIGIHLYASGLGVMQTTYVYEWKNTSGDRWVLVKTEENNVDEYVSSMNVDHYVDEDHVVRTHTHSYTEGKIIDSERWVITSKDNTITEKFAEVEFTWNTPPSVIICGKESETLMIYRIHFLNGADGAWSAAYAQITMRADGPTDGYATDETYHYFDFTGDSGTGININKEVYDEADSVYPNGDVTKEKVMKENAILKIYVEGGMYGGGATYTYAFVPKDKAIGDAIIGKTSDTVPVGADVVVNTKATNSAGEAGVAVPAVIAVGLLGAAAALGAASGAESNADNSENDKNGKSYKMYISKNFGDAIRYDKPGVPVYARMVEISKEGTEIDRFDLTQQVEIFSGSSVIKVRDSAVSGNYIGAFVEAESVANAKNPEEGVVSFKFTGEGGTFQNNVKFRLVGEPYIKFDEQGDSLFMTVNIIEGDDAEYIVPLTLVDFTQVPKVGIKPQEESPFVAEIERIDDFKYKVKIKNQSVKSEKPNAQSQIFNVEVSAESETEYQSNSFRAVLYPEGLTVSIIKFDSDGYAQIGAYNDNEKVEDGEEVLATRFKVELAVSSIDEQGRTKAEIVDISKTNIKFNAIKGSDTTTANLAMAFKYEIEEIENSGIYKFQPKMQIPESRTKYYLMLPISCDYENKAYNLDLPIRLIGEPFNEMKEKKEELDFLLKRIRRYMPPEDWSRVIGSIKENYDNMSPKEIRLLNRSLYEITRDKLLNEAQANINYAEALDWVIWGLEWVKWIGDQAFSYVLLSLGGPAGPLADALLSPTKEIMVSLISENIWYREGISSPEAKLRGVNGNLMAMLENSLMTQISSETSLKKAGFILASFTVVKIVNHYYNDIGADGKPIGFYDAILAGLGDLTANAFKFIVSEKFDQLAKSPKAKEYFQKYTGDWVMRFLDSNAAGWREKGLGAIKKYVEELCGLNAAKVYTKASQIELETKAGDLVININLWDDPNDAKNSIIVSLNVMKIKDQLYDYIFTSMFDNFPFATTLLTPPADPMFIVQK